MRNLGGADWSHSLRPCAKFVITLLAAFRWCSYNKAKWWTWESDWIRISHRERDCLRTETLPPWADPDSTSTPPPPSGCCACCCSPDCGKWRHSPWELRTLPAKVTIQLRSSQNTTALTQWRNAFLDFLVNFLFLTLKNIDISIYAILRVVTKISPQKKINLDFQKSTIKYLVSELKISIF